ncbi:MAG TPA: serine/threonine-protein kinase [Kofleriaceae bacterium]|nr:serine/threonine-protein kinase [Kofleriaceae bacterium]
MFRAVYVYGHLLTIAFSALMALAFAMMARRLYPRDWGHALIFLSTAAAGAAEMAQAATPTVVGGRLLFVAYAIMFLTATVTLHAEYAADALPPARRRPYRAAVAVFAAFVLSIVVPLIAGAFDDGLRPLELWGARSGLPAITPVTAGVFMLVPLGNLALTAEMLLREGPRRGERLALALPLTIAPIISLHELGMAAGIGPGRIPIGGYVAAFLGVVGVMTLVARLEEAAAQRRQAGQFAGYELEDRLGAGGMAEVFRARRATGPAVELGVQKEVAIKRMHAGFSSDPRFVEMFVEEARLVARLHHPNIITLHDVGVDRGQLYLAMELVDGLSLSKVNRALARRGERMPVAVAAEIGIQVADALAHAHGLTDEAGRPLELVHRDVSPQNILVDRTGVVKLADFGIARTAERVSRTATGVLKGKVPYVAPEQIKAEPYDHRADLYALGVVLFELATGRTPFDAPSEAAVIYQIVDGRAALPLLDGTAPILAATVRACLSLDPAARPPSAVAMRQSLLPLREEVVARRKLGELVSMARDHEIESSLTTSVATVVDTLSGSRTRR